jgi:DNA-directed RNA polymerase subunit RPC12/RpoP
MPTIRFYSCGHCRKSLGREGVSYNIGEPLLQCPNCGGVNNVVKSRNEWDLMGGVGHFNAIGTVVLFGIWCGAGAGWMAFAGLTKFTDWTPGWPEWLSALIGVPFGLWYFWHDLHKEIVESRTRMDDPAYVETLRQHRLMK